MPRYIWAGVSFFIVAVAVLIIVFSPEIGEWLAPSPISENRTPSLFPPVAELQSSNEALLIKKNSSPRFVSLPSISSPLVLHPRERLQLPSQARAIVHFSGGYRIQLEGDSEFLFDRWNPKDEGSPALLRIVEGTYKVLQKGSPGSVFVIQKGRLFVPEHPPQSKEPVLIISQQTPSMEEDTLEEMISSTKSSPSPSTETTESLANSLANAYLEKMIATKRPQFHRCQTKALRENQKALGRIVVGMQVTSRGQVKSVKVLESNLQSGEFENCVTSVFERLKLKSFSGPDLAFSYPIVFE